MNNRLLLFFLLLHTALFADMEPGFEWQSLSWKATNIIVAKCGADKKTFTVIESWKGNLAAGKKITVGHLDHFKTASRKENSSWDDAADLSLQPGFTFDRVVLFLRQDSIGNWVDACFTNAELKEDNIRRDDAFEEEYMKLSVAWIRSDTAYAFFQWMNPGPRLLEMVNSQKPFSETDLKQHVQVITVLQQQFFEVCRNPDPEKRARQLQPFVASDLHYFMHPDLDDAIFGCGKSGLNMLTRILRSDSTVAGELHLLQLIGFHYGDEACSQLVELLGLQKKFWEQQAGVLKPGWFDDKSYTHDARQTYLASRNGKTYYIVAFTAKLKCPEAKAALKAFGDLWFANPQLEVRPNDQVSGALKGGN